MNCKELETARLLNQIIHVDVYVGASSFGVDFVMAQTHIPGVVAREPLQDTRNRTKFFKSHASLLKFLQWFEKLPLHPEFSSQDKLQYPFRLRFLFSFDVLPGGCP